MAIKPSTLYPGQTGAPNAGYPEGSAQNVTVSGDGTGTPLEKTWVNDLWGWLQALLDKAGIVASGAPDEVGASQYLDALEAIFGEPSAQRAFASADYTTGAPFSFGTTPQTQNLKYLPGQARWYSASIDVSGDTVYVYDSADGITWSAVTTLNTTQGRVPFWEQGGDLYVGSGDNIYKSTTGLVTDLVAQNPTFPNLVIIFDLLFDSTNGLWIACGSNGAGNSIVETAATVTGTWTTRQNVAASAFVDMAHDGAGRTILLIFGSSSWQYSSDGGVNWTTNGAPTGVPVKVYWSDSLQRFALNTSSGTDFFMLTTDGTDLYERTVTDNIQTIINLPQGVVVVYDVDGDDRLKWELWSGDHPLGVSQAEVAEFFWNTTSGLDIIAVGDVDTKDATDKWVILYDSNTNPKIARFDFS